MNNPASSPMPAAHEFQQAALLIDGAAYFDALVSVLERAQESVLIVGWDIRSDVSLRPQAEDPDRYKLAAFLDRLTQERPELHVNVLGWDFSPVYAVEREFLSAWRFAARTGPRVHFHLAADHSNGAAHHQKIIVVDDSVAFIGGIDLSIARWDMPGHIDGAQHRKLPSGEPYGPFHDTQLCVDGDAARALGDLCRERYADATGDELPIPTTQPGLWPEGVAPDFLEQRVRFIRTRSAHGDLPALCEVEDHYLQVIAEARYYLYFENQYVTSTVITEALCRSLRNSVGPEVVIVTPQHQSGRLEQATMGVLRARRLHELQEADRHDRLRVVSPVLHDGEEAINVHAKLLIADDRIFRVGSANLSNRSMRLDTECDAVIEADDSRDRIRIRKIRDTLLAEHLHVTVEDVEDCMQQRGSLRIVIEELSGREEGTLVPLKVTDGQADALPGLSDNADLVDASLPLDEALASKALPVSGGRVRSLARRIPLRLLFAALVVLIGALWMWSPLGQIARPERLAAALDFLRDTQFGALAAVAMFVIAAVLMVPVTVLIVAMALVFGPWTSFVGAFTGSLLAAAITYALGRYLFRDWVQRKSGEKLNRMSEQLQKRGAMAVAAVRVLPIAPFTVINLMAGASAVRPRDFLLGTAIGMGPGIFALCLASGPVVRAIRDPNPKTIAISFGLVLLVFALGHWGRKLAERLGERLGGNRAKEARS